MEIKIDLKNNQKVYFLSDLHLGYPDYENSLQREKVVTTWLDSIKNEAHSIVFAGDVFDYWFEYRYVVPKYHIRFLGKIAELYDMGISLYFFRGNHDMWCFDYLSKQFGALISRRPLIFNINGQKIFAVHGDGLGPGDYSHKVLMKVFENKFLQYIYSKIHPDITFWLAQSWSYKSRMIHEKKENKFLGEKEWFWQYAMDVEKTIHHDYYVAGHRHLPMDMPVGDKSKYINLGDWITHYSYAVYDGSTMSLCKYEPK
ncbi:MAG: UDP-2,3-diacylglucosamine diphosphatase [Cytophagales bacterium]|nr:UDP-2,3-diacylglucosamine diphosphatase [Cytophagales bacterium]